VRDATVVNVEAVTARLTRRFGPEVADWCAHLPVLADDLADRWRLRVATDGPARLLHGDLHAGNVLRAEGGRGLVAIDPRPCLGDPAFDAVDWVLAAGGGEQAVRQRIDWLANHAAGPDPDRVWAWCRVMAVIVAVLLLMRRPDDPAAEDMLAIARSSPT
jgi:streptomycin 6-kinase